MYNSLQVCKSSCSALYRRAVEMAFLVSHLCFFPACRALDSCLTAAWSGRVQAVLFMLLLSQPPLAVAFGCGIIMTLFSTDSGNEQWNKLACAMY